MSMFRSIFELCFTPGALKAFVTWKKFSLSSFRLVKRLTSAGVVPVTVIDVGANVGQFSVAASNEFCHADIYPIEPDPQTATKLSQNLPPITAANIIKKAVGERDGTIVFNVNVDSQVSSILPLGDDRQRAFPKSVVMQQISVPLATLDSIFSSIPLAEPILLKIDVQGYEDKVIAGASNILNSVSWIVMEVSFARLYEGELDFMSIISIMSKHGFRFVRPLNFHQVRKSLDIIEMDALFERCN
jgi:FkbM family methyltransferase